MGTKVAPTYATLILGHLAHVRTNYTVKKAQFWTIYNYRKMETILDDCFSFWSFSLKDLNCYENVLNSLHKDIQLSHLSDLHIYLSECTGFEIWKFNRY